MWFQPLPTGINIVSSANNKYPPGRACLAFHTPPFFLPTPLNVANDFQQFACPTYFQYFVIRGSPRTRLARFFVYRITTIPICSPSPFSFSSFFDFIPSPVFEILLRSTRCTLQNRKCICLASYIA